MGIENFPLFLISGFLLNITPGPALALVVTIALRNGSKVGAAGAFGVVAGAVTHTIFAAVGLSALLMATAWGFTAVKLVGAAYLIWLGGRLMFQPKQSLDGGEVGRLPEESQTAGQAFRLGYFTNLLNPKVALFFLAFVPQFVAVSAPNKSVAFLALGLSFNLMSYFWYTSVAVLVGRVGRSGKLGNLRLYLERAVGSVFIGLGIAMASRTVR